MTKVSLVACLSFLAVAAFAQTDAKSNFQQKCALCHGTDGKARVAMSKMMGAPDLTSQQIQSQTDAQIRQAIANGKGKMPAYGSTLGKDGLDAMVKHIRSLAPQKPAAKK